VIAQQVGFSSVMHARHPVNGIVRIHLQKLPKLCLRGDDSSKATGNV
jgi:hypothetical protein